MIETIVKPQPLDNDIAVMKIIQLMGQLSLNDLAYILGLVAKVYLATEESHKHEQLANYINWGNLCVYCGGTGNQG